MSTDRELLELAAKAAGIQYHSYIEHELIGRGINIGDLDTPIWNPLDQDGDALRLAAALHIDIVHIGLTVRGRTHSGYFGNGEHGVVDAEVAEFGSDRAANIRRAIVRAAAEIGKVTP